MSAAARIFGSLGVMTACAALTAWPLASHAQSVSEATADSLLRSAANNPSAAAAAAREPARPLWQPTRHDTGLQSLRVIELPDEGPQLGPPKRKHHALTWRNDALSQSLGNAGLGHTDCHNRVRLPSRLRAAPDGGPALRVQLQLAIGCSF